eukprot:scaffold80708_cov75-Phaeocystis_antarctica.AAC.12
MRARLSDDPPRLHLELRRVAALRHGAGAVLLDGHAELARREGDLAQVLRREVEIGGVVPFVQLGLRLGRCHRSLVSGACIHFGLLTFFRARLCCVQQLSLGIVAAIWLRTPARALAGGHRSKCSCATDRAQERVALDCLLHGRSQAHRQIGRVRGILLRQRRLLPALAVR